MYLLSQMQILNVYNYIIFFRNSKMGTSSSLWWLVVVVVPSLYVYCVGMLSHTMLLVRQIVGHGGCWIKISPAKTIFVYRYKCVFIIEIRFSLFPISLQWCLPNGWLGGTTRVFIGYTICSSSIWSWAGTCSAIHRRKFITTHHQLYIWNHNKYFYFIAYIPKWLGCSPPTWGNSPPSCGTFSVPLQSFILLL